LSEEVKRFPELKQLYELTFRLKKDYPNAAEAIDEWWTQAIIASYYARECDFPFALFAIEELGENYFKMMRAISKDADRFEPDKIYSDIDAIFETTYEYFKRLSNIFAKNCGCKTGQALV
jgi:hypothetical protein